MKLKKLLLRNIEVKNLDAVKNQPLTQIFLPNNFKKIDFLKKIKTLKSINYELAKRFWRKYNKVQQELNSIEKLKHILTKLQKDNSKVNKQVFERLKNISNLKLNLERVKELTDISSLKGIPLKSLNISATGVSDISALKGMPLNDLSIENTKIIDISVLKGMPLRSVRLPKNVKTVEFLRKVRSLRYINGSPSHLYWKKYDIEKSKNQK